MILPSLDSLFHTKPSSVKPPSFPELRGQLPARMCDESMWPHYLLTPLIDLRLVDVLTLISVLPDHGLASLACLPRRWVWCASCAADDFASIANETGSNLGHHWRVARFSAVVVCVVCSRRVTHHG